MIKILILGMRSLKNTVCSHFPVSILGFLNHICYMRHYRDCSTELDHAELLPLSICYLSLTIQNIPYTIFLVVSTVESLAK